MNIVTDYDIQALADNQLNPQQRERVLAHVKANLSAMEYYHRLQYQNIVLCNWWKTKPENGCLQ